MNVNVAHSKEHPDLTDMNSPCTKKCTSVHRGNTRSRKCDSPNISLPNPSKRSTKVEVGDCIVKNDIKT